MRAGFATIGVLLAGLLLAGCQGQSLEDIAPKAERQLPEKLITAMKAKGMTRTSPIMMRIFKEEGVLEVWKQKDTGRYALVTSYPICKWSGKLGPKYTEGDRQAPEGFYTINPYQMNPKSSYYLSFNVGYPNAYDRVNGRTGSNLMVHGACSSAGCYSMSDEQVAEIYAFARDAFRGGQQSFQLQAFPFRMTAENMARYRNDPNYEFWKMLKEGYDYFELTKMPPKVDVCEKRYVFNQVSADGRPFMPDAACPATSQPESLVTAYQMLKKNELQAFSKAIAGNDIPEPKPSIAGPKEARLVSAWSKARARGERVSREPPSLDSIAAETPAKAPVPKTAPAPAPAPTAVAEAEAPEPKTAAQERAPAPLAEAIPQAQAAAITTPEPKKKKAWWNLFGS